MKRHYISQLLCFLILIVLRGNLLSGQTTQATDVLTWHNNNLRDGLNNTETTLTQATVTASKVGKVCSTAAGAIDGQILAQPLVVATPGALPGATQEVVYIATMNDSVYFIEGNSKNCAVLNHISLLLPHERAVQCSEVGGMNCTTLAPIIGI